MGIATWIGVFLGFGTLGAAFFAAKFAKEAADHTADGAKAAWAAADHAERSMAELERPYLVFVPQPVSDAEPDAPLAYSFANYGRTPCVIVHAVVQYLPVTQLSVPKPIRPDAFSVAISPDRIVVPPHAALTSPSLANLGKPFVKGAEKAAMHMAHGYALYRSTMGRLYICAFGLYWSAKDRGWRTLAAHYNYDAEIKEGWKPPEPVTITITNENDQSA